VSDKEGDEGLVKKPVKGSFQRVGDKMAEEMSDKSPTDAVKDDLSSSGDPAKPDQG